MVLVYSCCFWFSLRLGGMLIAFASIVRSILVQAMVTLIICCIGHINSEKMRQILADDFDEINLLYAKYILDNIRADPEKYTNWGISLSSIYIIVCLTFIYGAYTVSKKSYFHYFDKLTGKFRNMKHLQHKNPAKCGLYSTIPRVPYLARFFNNLLMLSYIIVEFFRLLILCVSVATGLLILKQNTMDLGLLIGASVASGFFLLGMWYLWVCASNLPILINEMERDEQAATIARLRAMLQAQNSRNFNKAAADDVHLHAPYRTLPPY